MSPLVQDFLPDCTLPGAPQCAVCGCGLVLLVQVYCPLEGSPYHRLLHVYCCTQQQCWSNPERYSSTIATGDIACVCALIICYTNPAVYMQCVTMGTTAWSQYVWISSVTSHLLVLICRTTKMLKFPNP